jgi:hypothetical protein
MRGWIRRLTAGRGVFTVLLLLALSVRLVVPTGFMPVATTYGIIVSLCSGSGPSEIFVELGKKGPAPQHSAADSPCAFAGLGAGLTNEPPALLPTVLPLPAIITLGRAIADLTVHRLAAPPPPAIGPPRSA